MRVLAKQLKGATAVELGAGDRRQVEGVGRQVGKVGITDRLLPSIAGAVAARALKARAEVIQIAPGGNARTPRHKRNPVILLVAGGVVRSAAPAVVCGQENKSLAA